MPKAIIQKIQARSRFVATLKCKLHNLLEKLKALEASAETGLIPPHLTFKFKKFFNKPEEAEYKTNLILNAIEQEKTKFEEEIGILHNDINTRNEQLKELLTPIMHALSIDCDMPALFLFFNDLIQSSYATFLLKQFNDAARKQLKKDKFEASKEINSAPATISVQQLKAMQSQVASLTKQLESIKLRKQNRSLKVKGPAVKKPTAGSQKKRKPTGTIKSSNGKGKSTVRNNKSAGRNGN